MASINTKPLKIQKTYEGAPASSISHKEQLRRAVMSCMLWEDQFYEDGQSIADRIVSLVPKVGREDVAAIAIEARNKMHLRHVPLLLVRELARARKKDDYVFDTLYKVIQRPDELTEFLAIYWQDGKCPLAAQVKKALALAFHKFDKYALAKYNRDGAIKLRDVLFLTHPCPASGVEAETWKSLVDGTLETPDTWEVALSSGADKKSTWERLLQEDKLGGLALLRNLRNMDEAGVKKEFISEALIRAYIADKFSKVLPFRFIAAARAVPQLEDNIELVMLWNMINYDKLSGRTAIVVDNSGSMHGTKVSAKSDIDRSDAACALATLLREICEDCVVIGFGSTPALIPSRRGFALRDAILHGPGGGTDIEAAKQLADKHGYDRIIIVTDEQSNQRVTAPITAPSGVRGKGYIINVAGYENGIGYGTYTHINGWSEAVVDYIRMVETNEQ